MAPRASSQSAIKTPEDFFKRYATALATQNWEVVAPLIHEDACVTFSGGESFRGKAAVRTAFEGNFALIRDEEYTLSDLHRVCKSPAFAVFTFSFAWSGVISGKPAAGGGRGTSVLVKENGRWLLLAEHLGPAPK